MSEKNWQHIICFSSLWGPSSIHKPVSYCAFCWQTKLAACAALRHLPGIMPNKLVWGLQPFTAVGFSTMELDILERVPWPGERQWKDRNIPQDEPLKKGCLEKALWVCNKGVYCKHPAGLHIMFSSFTKLLNKSWCYFRDFFLLASEAL